MSYYQGDFYQGDYYAGDPGLFSVLKKVAGVAAGFLPGGGAVTSLAKIASGTLASRGGAIVRRTGGAIAGAVIRHPVLSAAGAAGVVGGMGAAIARHGPSARTSMGRMGGRGGARGGFGRRRRMNPYNPRALRRAVRRAMAFSRMARRVLSFTHPKAAHGRPHFKFRRKKRV